MINRLVSWDFQSGSIGPGGPGGPDGPSGPGVPGVLGGPDGPGGQGGQDDQLSLDGMHSENIWFSLSKSSNYIEKLSRL